MTGHGPPPTPTGERAGCLRATAGVAALAVLAPFALAVRTYRSWRRGTEIRIERITTEVDLAAAGPLARIDVLADVPPAVVENFQRSLTDTVVRVAEALRQPDDVYHVLYRDRAAAETVVLPVGPQLQELGDRFHLVLTDGTMAGRTVAWLTLSRGRRLVELVDPFEYDPEDEGEPERLLGTSGMRWGMATAFTHRGPAMIFRVVLYVRRESAEKAEAVMDRLSR